MDVEMMIHKSILFVGFTIVLIGIARLHPAFDKGSAPIKVELVGQHMDCPDSKIGTINGFNHDCKPYKIRSEGSVDASEPPVEPLRISTNVNPPPACDYDSEEITLRVGCDCKRPYELHDKEGCRPPSDEGWYVNTEYEYPPDYNGRGK